MTSRGFQPLVWVPDGLNPGGVLLSAGRQGPRSFAAGTIPRWGHPSGVHFGWFFPGVETPGS